MELYKLFVSLGLNSAGFENALSGAAGSMGSFVKKLGVTQLAIEGLEKAFELTTKMVTSSVDNFANYEQLIGGVETLFKDEAEQVKSFAEQAYKTAGISANQYMETVTSFSASLMQGLGEDTDQAAEIANMAVTDMADNVNKMGSSMESVQNAYKGFAKGNFTMLDNLKLGYGGTREEMVRLINESGVLDEKINNLDGISFDTMIKAIHKVQDNMGITGTTAKEAATTISGSKASMKAAFEDLLTAIPNGDSGAMNTKMQQFQEALSGHLKMVIPKAINAVGGAGALFHGIVDAITDIDTGTFSDFAVSAEVALSGTIGAFSDLVNWLILGIADTFKNPEVTQAGAEDFGASIGDFIGTTLKNVVSNLPSILTGALDIGLNIGKGLIEGLFAGLFGEEETFSDEMEEAIAIIGRDQIEGLKDAEANASKAHGIVDYLDSLIQKYGDTAKEQEGWAEAVERLDSVLPGAKNAIENHEGDLNGLITTLHNTTDAYKEMAIEQVRATTLGNYEATLANAQSMLAGAQADLEIQKSLVETTSKSLGLSGNLDTFEDLQFTGLMAKVFDIAAMNEESGEGFGERYATEALLDTLNGDRNWERLAREYASKEGRGVDLSEEEITEFAGQMKILTEAMDNIEVDEKMIPDLENAVAIATVEFETASAALERFASKVNGISLPTVIKGGPFSGSISGGTGRGNNTIMSHATGLDNVPFNGYQAELHKNEMVLTAAEADDYRRGNRGGVDYQRIGTMIGSAIDDTMSRINVYLGADKVGNLTTATVGRNISAQTHNKLRGMGG